MIYDEGLATRKGIFDFLRGKRITSVKKNVEWKEMCWHSFLPRAIMNSTRMPWEGCGIDRGITLQFSHAQHSPSTIASLSYVHALPFLLLLIPFLSSWPLHSDTWSRSISCLFRWIASTGFDGNREIRFVTSWETGEVIANRLTSCNLHLAPTPNYSIMLSIEKLRN